MKRLIEYAEKYRQHWRHEGNHYWLAKLQEEVAELTLTLEGKHEGPLAHELAQIASICMNWLDKEGDFKWPEESTR